MRAVVRSLAALAATLLLAREATAGGEVVVLKSKDMKAYNAPAAAFKGAVGAPCEEYDLGGDLDKGRSIVAKLSNAKERPRLVLAVGEKAAIAARDGLKEVPIVFAMVLNWERLKLRENAMVTGIAVEVPPDAQLTQLKLFAPKTSKVGVIYSEAFSREVVERGRAAAAALGMELHAEAVDGPDGVPVAWEKMEGKVDALWMVADPTVYNSTETFQLLREKCDAAKVPFMGSSDSFVKAGCLVSVGADYDAMGYQAAALARKILDGGVKPAAVDVQEPIGTYTALNKKVADALGLTLGKDLLALADKLIGAEE